MLGTVGVGKNRDNNALTRSLCTYIVIKRRLFALVLANRSLV